MSIRTGHVSNIFPKSRISRESTNKYLKIYAGRKKVTERKGSATVKNESKRTHPMKRHAVQTCCVVFLLRAVTPRVEEPRPFKSEMLGPLIRPS